MLTATLRGFTLIELMVVVSIIALLSSVVLTSLNSARDKARDSAIKSSLHTVLVQSALYFSNSGNYGTPFPVAVCSTAGAGTMLNDDVQVRSAIAYAASVGGGGTRCVVTASAYAVSVALKTTTDHWCVDSTGSQKRITNLTWAGPACP